MFSTDQLIADCLGAIRGSSPGQEIKEIAKRAVSDSPGVARELGPPIQSGIYPLYESTELTILNIVWAPGMSIYPHDHRMWGVIAVYEGREDNAFFKRTAGGLKRASARHVETGDAVLLGANTIHAVTNPLGQFTCALQIYGGDFFHVARSEFDPVTLEERPYDVEKAKKVFLDANQRLAS
jgi:predicted metal-dependent enzyme (double-stranded beta helix superfamily)